ncbi:MAG: hypothetical protein K6G60_10625 [Lachnospiraceae bacterium]|nr:hypothetical protein [Lachnospiraceae bacterium]
MKKRLNLLVLLLFIVIFGVIDSIEYILSKDFGIQMIGNVALYLFEIIVTILLVKVSSKGDGE